MIRYEILFLTVPAITSDEVAAIQEQCAQLIKDHKAFLISFERWGKYQLSYPIRRHDYGVYFLVRFEVENNQKKALLDALKAFFAVKHNELVMRSVTTVLGENGSLEYRRPESLDDIPSREYASYNQQQSAEAIDNQ